MIKQELSLDFVLEATGGNIIGKGSENFNNISTDSRTIEKGELFVPLTGENFNGHKFVQRAIEKGASGILFQKGEECPSCTGITLIEVINTLKAYQAIALAVRKKINPYVIGITGSSGKTSTKEISYAFLKKYFPTFKTEGNFNNEIGVPQTLLKLEPNFKLAIIEMGMRGKGQIKELSEIAQPNCGIITGIGSAHIEILGSVSEIARAKWELAEYLKESGGALIIPAFDPNLVNLSGDFPSENLITINLEPDKISTLVLDKSWIENEMQYFSFLDRDFQTKHTACLSVPGKHQISNALLSLAIGKLLKFSYPDFIDLSFDNLSGRSEIIQIASLKIINDAYNANPESMKAAIETFFSVPSDLKKILVLGEMRELGDYSAEAHFSIGKYCSGFDMEKLLVISETARGIKEGFEANSKYPDKVVFCKDNREASEYLKKYLDSNIEILLKASRGAKLEEVLENLGGMVNY